MPTLTILHTNDLHGKLTELAAEIIAREKASCEPCLLVDCGDAISSGNIYYRLGGEPVISKMSDIGYDAMAMGNREFHFMEMGLKSKVSLARFPVLCANLRKRDGDAVADGVRPSIELQVGDVRVALFGLTVPMITRKMVASKFSPYWFEDPLLTASEVVPELRKRADIVIALTHIGLHKDRELAASIDGIDLLVGGHTHAVLTEPEWIGSTAVVQAGWWGHYLGRTTIHLGEAKCRNQIREELIDLRV